MFKFYDIAQNTDDWFKLRAGKITSSKLGCIMANYGKAFGDPAKKYAVQIAVERITGTPLSSDYTNVHMERGTEQEPIARDMYEETFFCDVTNGGFFGNDNIGCSPDGLVGEDGVIEIKCHIVSAHYANIKRMSYDPTYKWQFIGNLKFTGRKWIDYISYCGDFPVDKQLYTYRINRDDVQNEFKMIDSRVQEFEKLIKQSYKTILESNYLNA